MWKDNLKFGDGKLIKANGDKYIGEFLNDKINGRGEYIYSNGDKYIGEFKDNVFHGHGCYINASGDTYEGEYRYGLKKGYGILKSIDNTVSVSYTHLDVYKRQVFIQLKMSNVHI